jgi:hypothetical protein
MRPLLPSNQYAATTRPAASRRLASPVGVVPASVASWREALEARPPGLQKRKPDIEGTSSAPQHCFGGMNLRVLFVTSEIDDLVRVGGLAAVSAALPRALQAWADVRVLLPGYREVMTQLNDLEIVGECPPLAQLPACSLGRTTTPDGLPIYILITSR